MSTRAIGRPMGYLTIAFNLVLIAQTIPGVTLAQIQPDQVGLPPDSSQIWILGVDTAQTSTTYGKGRWYAMDSIGVGSGGIDADWYETGEQPPDEINDEIYHKGDVHVGDSTMIGDGKLNILGRIDQRFPTLSLHNIAIGANSGNTSMTGNYNVFLGPDSGLSATSGGVNTGLGARALMALTDGEANVAVGYETLAAYTGCCNTGIGYRVMLNNTTGSGNVAIGFWTMHLGTGANNTATGAASLYEVTGGNNVAVGNNAGRNTQAGSQNTYIGMQSGAGTEGNNSTNNVMIGYQAGFEAVDNDIVGSVFIGHQAGYSETTSNKLYIDNSTTSQPLVYGDFSSDFVGINGGLGYTTEGSTATTLSGRDASEFFTDVSIGEGLSLSEGTLKTTPDTILLKYIIEAWDINVLTDLEMRTTIPDKYDLFEVIRIDAWHITDGDVSGSTDIEINNLSQTETITNALSIAQGTLSDSVTGLTAEVESGDRIQILVTDECDTPGKGLEVDIYLVRQ